LQSPLAPVRKPPSTISYQSTIIVITPARARQERVFQGCELPFEENAQNLAPKACAGALDHRTRMSQVQESTVRRTSSNFTETTTTAPSCRVWPIIDTLLPSPCRGWKPAWKDPSLVRSGGCCAYGGTSGLQPSFFAPCGTACSHSREIASALFLFHARVSIQLFNETESRYPQPPVQAMRDLSDIEKGKHFLLITASLSSHQAATQHSSLIRGRIYEKQGQRLGKTVWAVASLFRLHGHCLRNPRGRALPPVKNTGAQCPSHCLRGDLFS
jgi:hypothetical protein